MTLWHNIMLTQLNDADSGYRNMTPQEEHAIRELTYDDAIRMKQVLHERNGMVVDYNPVSSAVLRCNTAMYLLGSQGQYMQYFII
jgi:hypothetical protein